MNSLVSYRVLPGDSIFSICRSYNITPQGLIEHNRFRYPGLAENPGIIFVGWDLAIPIVVSGGSTEFGV